MIDLVEVSAGGGTVIWVDDYGSLRVGPLSVGADPGPVRYGKGGIEPIITDANIILHRLNPKYLLNGEMKIFKDYAVNIFKRKILEHANLDLEEAAYGTIKLINTHMANAIRIATIERGLDPRNYVLTAFGGAEPLHACELAEEMNINKVIIPIKAGVFSSIGLLMTDFKIEVTRQVNEGKIKELQEYCKELEVKILNILERNGFSRDNVVLRHELLLRYKFQDQEINITFNPEDASTDDLIRKYEEIYRRLYGYTIPEEKIEISMIKTVGIGIIHKQVLKKIQVEE